MYFSPGFALICLWSVIIIIEELFCFNKLPGCVSLCCEVPCKLCAFTLQLSSCVLCVLRAGDVTCTQGCSFQIRAVVKMKQESAAPLPVELESGLRRGLAGWGRSGVEHRALSASPPPPTCTPESEGTAGRGSLDTVGWGREANSQRTEVFSSLPLPAGRDAAGWWLGWALSAPLLWPRAGTAVGSPLTRLGRDFPGLCEWAARGRAAPLMKIGNRWQSARCPGSRLWK